jgi:tRNA(Ile2) C34 agmatinyltransferase TiaS
MTCAGLGLMAFPALILTAVFVVLWRRHHNKRGSRCWQCGTDLRGTAKIDFRGHWRCPKCGDLIEADEPGRVDRL